MRYDEEKELIFLLEQIEDPRHARGIRYRFADLLLICIYAVLAGHSEGSDMAVYAGLNGDETGAFPRHLFEAVANGQF